MGDQWKKGGERTLFLKSDGGDSRSVCVSNGAVVGAEVCGSGVADYQATDYAVLYPGFPYIVLTFT